MTVTIYDGRLFNPQCDTCGAPACFHVGLDIAKGIPGRQFCGQHWPGPTGWTPGQLPEPPPPPKPPAQGSLF